MWIYLYINVIYNLSQTVYIKKYIFFDFEMNIFLFFRLNYTKQEGMFT